MDIAVCIKQTVDTEAEIGVDSEGCVVTEGQALVIDPYSEFAVERAVQLVEERGGTVSVVCIGGDESLPAVRHALSMGADVGILVSDEALARADGAARARVLAAALRRVGADLIMGGCKSADMSNAQMMPRLAGELNLACVNVVTELEVDAECSSIRARREVDDGTVVVNVALPAVISAQQGLAEPRYPNVRSIMQSRKKPVTVWTLADLAIDPASVASNASKTRVVRFRKKPPRAGGFMVEGDTVSEKVETTVEMLASTGRIG